MNIRTVKKKKMVIIIIYNILFLYNSFWTEGNKEMEIEMERERSLY